MNEMIIKATKAEDIFESDPELFEEVIGDIEDAIGDNDGTFVCTGELALGLIEDSCSKGTHAKAKKLLSDYEEKLVVFNADNLPE